MIVRDEAPVVDRCIASVAPLVHRWTVFDTGSKDGMPDVVRAALGGLPGKLHHRTWRDFGHNRSEALALARPWTDYSLIIDADDVLEAAPGFVWPALRADLYALDILDTGAVYRRPQLLKNALPWRYCGVLHEFPACEAAGRPERLPGLVLRRGHDRARRSDPNTYRRDAALLEAGLDAGQDPKLQARYAFCLGNSWRDCGETSRAVAAFWTGRYRESLDAGLRALANGVPSTEQVRVLHNMRAALDCLLG